MTDIIQWFPGHMTKALRMMQAQAKLIDVFIYVLDSRAPYSSINPEFVRFVGDKPIIYVLNKYDLADSEQTKKWCEYYDNIPNSMAVMMNATESKCGKVIINAIDNMMKDKLNSNRLKGANFIFRAMIMGVPNSGKSTLINNVCGKARAITGNKAGVTRAKQWVKIGPNLEIMDSPGTLWPSFEDMSVGRHLAYIGSVKDEVVDIERLALEYIKEITALYPSAIPDRYGIDISDMSAIEIYEEIARKRGCRLKKDEIDYTRAAHIIIGDFRKGLMGRITLEHK